ncbi:MAG: FAD-dependent oxidoreductase [candidate division NC10 bacterium]|nr:FAD-dependent oxidoreductase [candidate division NC10 bacterium]
MAYDVAVIGAGVFGSWTAYHLQKSGKKVVLLDAHGAANSRASSGGESRIIRMGYGPDELYTRWSTRSLSLWQAFFQQIGQRLFHPTGVLWMAREKDPYTLMTLATLQMLDVRHETLSRSVLEARYPQIAFGSITWAVFEPDSGVLMARRATQAVAEETVRSGAGYLREAVGTPSGKGRLASVTTGSGATIRAGHFVFACGPWLPTIFSDLLGGRIFPTRQEVFFFGTPPGDRRFASPAMPTWIDFGEQFYGIPDLENRGFKLACDRHGPAFDPDLGDRTVTREAPVEVREFVGRRFPALKDAPLVEARVCQYENTSTGDFLIDRHPDFDNVWLVGGGSGHGFKHGPALGEYVAARLADGGSVEPRFSLAAKDRVRKRSVF